MPAGLRLHWLAAISTSAVEHLQIAIVGAHVEDRGNLAAAACLDLAAARDVSRSSQREDLLVRRCALAAVADVPALLVVRAILVAQWARILKAPSLTRSQRTQMSLPSAFAPGFGIPMTDRTELEEAYRKASLTRRGH